MGSWVVGMVSGVSMLDTRCWILDASAFAEATADRLRHEEKLAIGFHRLCAFGGEIRFLCL